MGGFVSERAHLDPQELSVNSRVHPFEIGVWRNHRLLKDQDSLYHTCNATGAFKMADITLDGPT